MRTPAGPQAPPARASARAPTSGATGSARTSPQDYVTRIKDARLSRQTITAYSVFNHDTSTTEMNGENYTGYDYDAVGRLSDQSGVSNLRTTTASGTPRPCRRPSFFRIIKGAGKLDYSLTESTSSPRTA